MMFGPLLVTAVLVGADWIVWDWSTATSHGTVGLIAGLLMAPLAMALVWFSGRALFIALRRGALRVASWARERSSALPAARTRPHAVPPLAASMRAPFDVEAERAARRAARRDKLVA